jgi:hypothetical protein
MGCKDKALLKLIQEFLDSHSIQAILLEKLGQGSQRAVLSDRLIGYFIHMTATSAMILLGSVDEMKINGKRTNYIHCSIQVAILYYISDFLV